MSDFLPGDVCFPLEAVLLPLSKGEDGVRASVRDGRGREVRLLEASEEEMQGSEPELAVLLRAVEWAEERNEERGMMPGSLFCPCCGREPRGIPSEELVRTALKGRALMMLPYSLFAFLLWHLALTAMWVVPMLLILSMRPLKRRIRFFQQAKHPELGRFHLCSSCGVWLDSQAYLTSGEIGLLSPLPGENEVSEEPFVGGSNTARAVRAIPEVLVPSEPVLGWIKGYVGKHDGIVVATPTRVVSIHQSMDGNVISRFLSYGEIRSVSFESGAREGGRGHLQLQRKRGMFRVTHASSVHSKGVAAFAALVQERVDEMRQRERVMAAM